MNPHPELSILPRLGRQGCDLGAGSTRVNPDRDERAVSHTSIFAAPEGLPLTAHHDGHPPKPLHDRAPRVSMQAARIGARENRLSAFPDGMKARPSRRLRRVATARTNLPKHSLGSLSLPWAIPSELAMAAEDNGD